MINTSDILLRVYVSGLFTAGRKSFQAPGKYVNLFLCREGDNSPTGCRTREEGLKAYTKMVGKQLYDVETGTVFMAPGLRKSTEANQRAWDPWCPEDGIVILGVLKFQN